MLNAPFKFPICNEKFTRCNYILRPAKSKQLFLHNFYRVNVKKLKTFTFRMYVDLYAVRPLQFSMGTKRSHFALRHYVASYSICVFELRVLFENEKFLFSLENGYKIISFNFSSNSLHVNVNKEKNVRMKSTEEIRKKRFRLMFRFKT